MHPVNTKSVLEVGPADAGINPFFTLPRGFSTSIGLDVYFPILISNMLAEHPDAPSPHEVVAADRQWR